MSRRAHKPTEQSRMLVRRLSGMAVPQNDIAAMVEVSDVSLRKYYRGDLDRGLAEANLKVVHALFQAATRPNNPNVVAQMFWLKNRAGWKDMGIVTTPADSVDRLTIEFVEPRSVAAASGMTIDGTVEPEGQSGVAPNVECSTASDDDAAEFEIDFADPVVS
jgi:hypothetical protein